jgi:hypothetical protein
LAKNTFLYLAYQHEKPVLGQDATIGAIQVLSQVAAGSTDILIFGRLSRSVSALLYAHHRVDLTKEKSAYRPIEYNNRKGLDYEIYEVFCRNTLARSCGLDLP